MIIYICLCLQVFSLFRCNSDECNTCWLHGLFTCNCKPTCARQPLTALRTCIQSSNWVHALLCRSLALLQWKWQHDYRVSICLCVCVCVCVCVASAGSDSITMRFVPCGVAPRADLIRDPYYTCQHGNAHNLQRGPKVAHFLYAL